MQRRFLIVLVSLTGILAAAFEPAPAVRLTDDEKSILELTNKARAEQKLPALALNSVLTEVARGHSRNMAAKGEMNHVLDDKTPAQRIKAAGYKYSFVGENIAMGENAPLQQIFDEWMKSKAHRMNILNAEFQEIGIGIARDDKGRVYYTQVFGLPRK